LNYPSDRIAYMLENSQVGILLTESYLQEKIPSFTGKKICLDTDWQDINQESKDNPIHETTLDNLIYVIYTSGSTGKPKGVLLNHYSVSNLVQWQKTTTKVTDEAKTLQFSPISFDVSCQEIFSTLSFGGTLVLISEDQRKDFNTLTDFLEKQEIERFFIPFVGLQIFTEVANLNQKSFPKLKEVITAGEQLKLSPPICSFFQRLSHCTLHNQYGPSESHVVTAFTLPENLENCSYLAPIGFPIDNTKIYILDPNLNLVPIGVTGELHIGGEVIARGYLNRQDLTQEKFIPNPFSEGKLYKTGDLCRYLPDGNIQYIGRIDNQVKMRGFRIELGEIDANLSEYSEIQKAVTQVHEDKKGLKSLVGYYVPQNPLSSPEEQNAFNAEIRQFLTEKLPAYMIPSLFIKLDALPLTPNGKVDRKALPKPETFLAELTANLVAPRNEIEEKIALIWQEVLNMEKVGVDNNFFELGGHSLSGIQMVSRLSKTFNIVFPLRALFEVPTIAQIAQRVETIRLLSQGVTEPLGEDEEEGEL
jgi:amino acid adenylation domain-containing protein